MARRLDYWRSEETFAWLDEREGWIFDRYLEIGRVEDLIEELGKAKGAGLTGHTFYAWIRATDEREERWDETVKLSAYFEADRASRIAENAEQATANADRLKADYRMRAAEWKNRDVFGKRPEVQVAIGVGGEWSQALDAVLDAHATVLERPRPTEQEPTRALPEPRTVAGTEVQPEGTPVQPSGEPSHD